MIYRAIVAVMRKHVGLLRNQTNTNIDVEAHTKNLTLAIVFTNNLQIENIPFRLLWLRFSVIFKWSIIKCWPIFKLGLILFQVLIYIQGLLFTQVDDTMAASTWMGCSIKFLLFLLYLLLLISVKSHQSENPWSLCKIRCLILLHEVCLIWNLDMQLLLSCVKDLE